MIITFNKKTGTYIANWKQFTAIASDRYQAIIALISLIEPTLEQG